MFFFINKFYNLLLIVYLFLLEKGKIPSLIHNIYLPNINLNSKNKKVEEFFISENKFKILVLPNYRFSIKKGWKMFKGLRILNHLNNRGLLNKSENLFFKTAVGSRTIHKSLEEIDSMALQLSKKNIKEFFINDDFY